MGEGSRCSDGSRVEPHGASCAPERVISFRPIKGGGIINTGDGREGSRFSDGSRVGQVVLFKIGVAGSVGCGVGLMTTTTQGNDGSHVGQEVLFKIGVADGVGCDVGLTMTT